jgi:hypothetical protein
MNNSYFPVGQVCNLSGQDAILSYDYFCDAIIRHAEVNKTANHVRPRNWMPNTTMLVTTEWICPDHRVGRAQGRHECNVMGNQPSSRRFTDT